MTSEKRIPAGTPTGGQFAASVKSEATGVSLGGAVPEIGEMRSVADVRRGDRFIFASEDGAADGDEIVTVRYAENAYDLIRIATEELDFDLDYTAGLEVRVVPTGAVTPGELRVGDKVRFGEGDDLSTVTSTDGGGSDVSIEFDHDESTISSYGDGDLFLRVEEPAQDAAPSGFATVREGGTITLTCHGCKETNTQPDKGLGRANLGAWRTRHQH